MSQNYFYLPNGYTETIEKGIAGVRRMNGGLSKGNQDKENEIRRLRKALESADAIVIGGGAGLSTSAGFTYSGERFKKYFFDFEERYGFHDMYSGGFYVMRLEPEIS